MYSLRWVYGHLRLFSLLQRLNVMGCSSPGASSGPSCFQRVALSRVLLFVVVAGVFSTIIGISKYFSVFGIGSSNRPKFVFRHFDGDPVATQSCKRRVLKASKRMVGKQSKCALLVPPVDDICEFNKALPLNRNLIILNYSSSLQKK